MRWSLKRSIAKRFFSVPICCSRGGRWLSCSRTRLRFLPAVERKPRTLWAANRCLHDLGEGGLWAILISRAFAPCCQRAGIALRPPYHPFCSPRLPWRARWLRHFCGPWARPSFACGPPSRELPATRRACAGAMAAALPLISRFVMAVLLILCCACFRAWIHHSGCPQKQGKCDRFRHSNRVRSERMRAFVSDLAQCVAHRAWRRFAYTHMGVVLKKTVPWGPPVSRIVSSGKSLGTRVSEPLSCSTS